MFDWLTGIFIPLLLVKTLVVSFCYICLSFHLYRIGIDERSSVKGRSALISLLISLSVFLASVYCLSIIDTSMLQLFFPFPIWN
jgi:hypothetical protein